MRNSPKTTNQNIIAIIQRTQIDESFAYRGRELADVKLSFMADHCDKVLDIGKSSRHRFSFFKTGQIVTMDINQYDDYPDIVDDICDITHIQPESFDGIIGNSILEHVYDPQTAVANAFALLKEDGFFYGFAPFLYRYHAPEALYYQDFYRYTKDGLAYLFKDFRHVTLYPIRGRISTMLNLYARWKFVIEKTFGQRINRMLDHFCSPKSRFLQVSGYYVWAQK
jgi:SAM-dependent methyltransferase